MDNKLRKQIADAVWEDGLAFSDNTLQIADLAIRAVIEALATEADSRGNHYRDHNYAFDAGNWWGFADWLRGHLGDTEVTE